MIIVRLMGGLGNQMFQYALGRSLSSKYRTSLWLDRNFFVQDHGPGGTSRRYGLGGLNVKGRCLPNKLSSLIYTSLKSNGLGTVEKQIRRGFMLMCEQSLDFDPGVCARRGNLYLDGYWQSERYFLDAASLLRNDFKLKGNISAGGLNLLHAIRRDGSASIHVRRGDYISNPAAAAFHGSCSVDWYKKTVDYLGMATGVESFVVFSDDIPWARANLGFLERAIFVDESFCLDECSEMYLMSQCRHHIIANSTFSWWGAWLNEQQDKLVIAPRRWFVHAHAPKDLLPSSWRLM